MQPGLTFGGGQFGVRDVPFRKWVQIRFATGSQFQTGTALGKGACNAGECLAAPGDTFGHLVNVCVCVCV